MSGAGNCQAWADFWSAGQGRAPACLPQALQAIDAAQNELWQGFGSRLPRRAQVLDIGTGDAVVLRKMRHVRPDLRLVGTDAAPTLPPPPRGIALRAGVAMESLPFGRAEFDAVTSQFGYEYADTKAAATQVARVLRAGGHLLFAVHRRDSPILAHNLPRREALRWALLESGAVEKARALLAARRLAPLPTPAFFSAAPAEASRRFPGQSAAGEFLQAVLHTLEFGRQAPPDQGLSALDELEAKARNEIARIDTLERAACDRERIGILADELAAAGLDMRPPGVLTERSGRPFAWTLAGVRLSDPGTSR